MAHLCEAYCVTDKQGAAIGVVAWQGCTMRSLIVK